MAWRQVLSGQARVAGHYRPTHRPLRPRLARSFHSHAQWRCSQASGHVENGAPKQRGWGGLKWTPIPIALGALVMGVQDYRHAQKREAAHVQGKAPEELVLDPWLVALIRKFPTRFLSSLFGDLMSMECPLLLRRPFYGLYVWAFGANLDEMVEEDLILFPSLQAFFSREIKPDVRTIDDAALMVSPCDGRVLYHGPVRNGEMEQVKGITYSLRGFIGGDLAVTEGPPDPSRHLHHIILYLAPGDYHRFHAPADVAIRERRYFPGDLLSVSPVVARLIKGLFNYNERVVLVGEWAHGLLVYAAVGAYNVGSIVIRGDDELRTNQRGVSYTPGEYRDKEWKGPGLCVSKGQELGTFRLGSTVVLIFEAPPDFEFSVQPGDRVLMGQRLGARRPADAA